MNTHNPYGHPPSGSLLIDPPPVVVAKPKQQLTPYQRLRSLRAGRIVLKRRRRGQKPTQREMAALPVGDRALVEGELKKAHKG